MDKKKHRAGLWRYLTFRSALLAGLLFVCVFLVALDLLPVVAVYIFTVIFAAAGWLFIVRPYLNIEARINLFLDGYTPAKGEGLPSYSVSPATRRLFDKLRDMLNPSQLFDMNKRQAQYLALQNQINPHFLYNTLESIRSEALITGLEDVANMTEALATFFRYTITKVENLVTVEEELQNCETYFSIQQYRFGSRLKLEILCAPEDKDEIYRCRLPKLTMQPILENSIIHGTELKVGAGHLTIRLDRTQKRLLIRVSDDGRGMDEAALNQLNGRLGGGNLRRPEKETKGGLALVNVNDRIRLLFGDEYGLHVFSMPNVGTDVEISIPVISSDREVLNFEALYDKEAMP